MDGDDGLNELRQRNRIVPGVSKALKRFEDRLLGAARNLGLMTRFL